MLAFILIKSRLFKGSAKRCSLKFLSLIIIVCNNFLFYILQIISVCENGDIYKWDIETGFKVGSIQTKQHQTSEVLAFAVDENAEYAVTGHLDGSGIVSFFIIFSL